MPATHREIALAALAAGAHVLCEKPFAPSLDEAQEMVEAARAAGRLLTVGFNMRYTANARALHDVVRKGHIGAPIYGRAWGRAGEPPWWGRHYERAVSGGGALAATAVHLVDLALWTGIRVNTVSPGTIDTPMLDRAKSEEVENLLAGGRRPHSVGSETPREIAPHRALLWSRERRLRDWRGCRRRR